MYLDGQTGHYHDWAVLHCPTMRELTNVRWIDTDTAAYCLAGIGGPPRPADRVVRARKIEVVPEGRLVLIDPIEGDSETQSFSQLPALEAGLK